MILDMDVGNWVNSIPGEEVIVFCEETVPFCLYLRNVYRVVVELLKSFHWSNVKLV
jgi:hypothetical protein